MVQREPVGLQFPAIDIAERYLARLSLRQEVAALDEADGIGEGVYLDLAMALAGPGDTGSRAGARCEGEMTNAGQALCQAYNGSQLFAFPEFTIMGYLVGVTALWAFSFSLIGAYLSGQVDSYFAVLTRIALAAAIFLFWLRPRRLSIGQVLGLMGIGAVQLGLMYIGFYQSFLLLSVPEVLLFTIFTPLYITLLDDLLKGRFTPFYLLTAALAVCGAAVIRYADVSQAYWLGFLVVQSSNLCFAVGQVAYRQLAPRLPREVAHRHVFGWFYLGALCVALPAFWLFGDATAMPTSALQWSVLAWLGIVASGLGYFLWNKGACRVDAGTLAVMNNALVPAGLAVNLLIWNRDADVPRLIVGGAILVAALMLNGWWRRRRMPQAHAA